MPAKSKSQQRFFGVVHAVQKGDMKAPSEKIQEAASDMGSSSVKHFAETATRGLPEKKKKHEKESMYRVGYIEGYVARLRKRI